MRSRANVQFVHAVAHGLSPEFLARHAQPSIEITRVEGATYNALAAADCAIVASGTATVEAALLGTPMVVVYRVAPLTASILRRMVRTPFIGMVNLIAGKRVCPELIQDDFTPEAVENEARRLLESPAAATKSRPASLKSAPSWVPAAPSSVLRTFSPGCCNLLRRGNFARATGI